MLPCRGKAPYIDDDQKLEPLSRTKPAGIADRRFSLVKEAISVRIDESGDRAILQIASRILRQAEVVSIRSIAGIGDGKWQNRLSPGSYAVEKGCAL